MKPSDEIREWTERSDELRDDSVSAARVSTLAARVDGIVRFLDERHEATPVVCSLCGNTMCPRAADQGKPCAWSEPAASPPQVEASRQATPDRTEETIASRYAAGEGLYDLHQDYGRSEDAVVEAIRKTLGYLLDRSSVESTARALLVSEYDQLRAERDQLASDSAGQSAEIVELATARDSLEVKLAEAIEMRAIAERHAKTMEDLSGALPALLDSCRGNFVCGTCKNLNTVCGPDGSFRLCPDCPVPSETSVQFAARLSALQAPAGAQPTVGRPILVGSTWHTHVAAESECDGTHRITDVGDVQGLPVIGFRCAGLRDSLAEDEFRDSHTHVRDPESTPEPAMDESVLADGKAESGANLHIVLSTDSGGEERGFTPHADCKCYHPVGVISCSRCDKLFAAAAAAGPAPYEPMACCGRERDEHGGPNPHCECPADPTPQPAPNTHGHSETLAMFSEAAKAKAWSDALKLLREAGVENLDEMLARGAANIERYQSDQLQFPATFPADDPQSALDVAGVELHAVGGAVPPVVQQLVLGAYDAIARGQDAPERATRFPFGGLCNCAHASDHSIPHQPGCPGCREPAAAREVRVGDRVRLLVKPVHDSGRVYKITEHATLNIFVRWPNDVTCNYSASELTHVDPEAAAGTDGGVE